MGNNNVFFLEVIEWFDPTGAEILKRIPDEGSGEIKYGAQLIVRESQMAVFFYKGKAIQAFGPGRHTLKTANIPVLNKLLTIPWGMTSPLRAEVYFINIKVFTNLKWGTRDPVAFRDEELGLVRLRAFGQFNIRVVQPLLFINTMAGTVASFSTQDVEEYLNRVIVSRLNDYLGEHLDSILSLPGRYDEIAAGLKERLREDLGHFGLELTHLYVNAITPPAEVQAAIDDRSKLGMFKNLDQLLRLKTAMAVEKAAEGGGAAEAGAGLGVGMLVPAMLSQALAADKSPAANGAATCPDCGRHPPVDANFCPYCGHQMMVFTQCAHCGKNLPSHARFCSRCGEKVEAGGREKKCPYCGTENLAQSHYCNHCGEKI